MLADFTITINDARKPMAVRVVIHDSVAALRSAATKYDNIAKAKHKKQRGQHASTMGICHRFHMMNDPLVAIVRFAPPQLGAGIVAHELGHAAVWLWEIQHTFSKKVPITCENDEWFCWVLGELVSKAVDKMYEKGVYPS